MVNTKNTVEAGQNTSSAEQANEAARDQERLGLAIKQVLCNFNKDSDTRKTTEKYFDQRIGTLEYYWEQVLGNDKTLSQLNVPQHEYYVKRYYDELLAIYTKAKTAIQARQAEFLTQQTEVRQEEVHNLSITIDPEQPRRLRKQQVNIENLSTVIAEINGELARGMTSTRVETRLEEIKPLWENINEMNLEILTDEPERTADYFTKNSFKQIKRIYDDVVEELKQKRLRNQETPSASKIVLPKVSIPIFDGSYESWSTFSDLFTKLVHENPSLSNTEKMQYLKTHLRGDALKSVQNLQISEESYAGAWDILTKKFKNSRLVLDMLLDKILGLPTLQYQSADKLQMMHDTTIECLQAVRNLGVDTSTWGPLIARIIQQKWDPKTSEAYVQQLKTPHEIQEFQSFMSFLESRYQALEAMGRTKNVKAPISEKEEASRPQSGQPKTNKNNCRYCGQPHAVVECSKFKALPVWQRTRFVKEKNICVMCLRHANDLTCFSPRKCDECNKPHNTLLHNARDPTRGQERQPKPWMKKENPRPPVSSHLGRQDQSVLITTALIKALSVAGTHEIVRVLIDPGSQASFITQRTAQLLGLPQQKIHAEVTGLGDSTPKVSNKKIEAQIKPRFHDDFEMEVGLLVLPKLTQSLPQKSFDVRMRKWRHLADPGFNKAGPIDMILGAEVFAKILTPGLRKTKCGLVAQNTKLGWILSGCIGDSPTKHLQVQSMVTRTEEDQQLTKFWEVEEAAEVVRNQTQEEKICEELYAESTTRNEDGSYTVKTPFSEKHEEMGKSKSRALSRFYQLEKRFERDPELRKEYTKFINEYIDLGHMEKVERRRIDEAIYYIPHQPVIKESSTTTKLRVVFDASCKTSLGISLNDIMYPGPRLQQELVDILIRWRKHKIVFTADIEKMYRQIWLHPSDRKYHRIFWRPNKESPLEEFELTTVTYGTTSAPFLAIRTLQQLASDEAMQYPKAAVLAMRDFYVDDVLSGGNSTEEVLALQTELINMMKAGKFTLRKWSSNEMAVIKHLPEEMRDMSAVEISPDEVRKSLGVHWAPFDDTFRFKVQISESDKITKRQILSEVAKIFDPLGWLSPIIIRAKMLIQELWAEKLDWDQPVPQGIWKKWLIFRTELKAVEEIMLSRWIQHDPERHRIELHGFCDASERAIGAVVYAKTIEASTGAAQVTLLVAKSKVAPTKGKVTLPRLELCAAVLLAKLLRRTVFALDIPQIPIYAWSDSTITVAWLKGNPNRWKTFVANRVTEVTEAVPAECWRHVRTEDNPADVISRGVDPTKLKDMALWWQGPGWLKQEKEWPLENASCEPCEEVKVFVAVRTEKHSEDEIIQRFSSLTRLVRVEAYCRRFGRRCRKQEVCHGSLTVQELEEALIGIVKRVQRSYFKQEVDKLQKGKPLEKNNKIYNLDPFMDAEGVMRVGGRLHKSQLSYNEKHQMILPYGGHFTRLLIDNAHRTMMHGGSQMTLGYLRRKFWIINGKKAVSGVIQKCHTCIRFKAQTAEQQMGMLPAARVTPSPPFSHTGVDYAGPIMLRTTKGRGHKAYKGYIAIFVCFATKAVHLEAVSDMSTDAFLAAFRRFTARRGSCSHMYSDNGTNFVGASKHLAKEVGSIVRDDEVQGQITRVGTQWHFIPPAAPNFGGLWEAGVKSMKHHLKRVIGDSTLTYEELTTLLHQIEACLNSRPLTALMNDPNDVRALTPGHLLIGRELVTPPDPMSTPINSSISSRWRLVQTMRRDFWHNWTTEYLNRLQQRYKWKSTKDNVRVGDLVLIREPINPSRWPLARVEEVHPGKDGLVRVVTMRKAGGVIVKRAINNVIPLPDREEEKAEERSEEQAISANVMTDAKQEDRAVTCKQPQQTQDANVGQERTRSSGASRLKWWHMCFFMLLMGTATAEEGKKFNIHHPPPGLYVEHIGQARIDRGTFRIELKFNRSQLRTDVETASNITRKLDEFCSKIKYLSDESPCKGFVSHLRELENEVMFVYNSTIRLASRERRGLLGQLMTSVFGVNDEVYEDIEKISQNQQELIKASSHQTKFMLSAVSAFNKTSERINKQLEHFHDKLNKGIDLINQMSRWYSTVDKNQLSIHFLVTYETGKNFMTEIIHCHSKLLEVQINQATFYELITHHEVDKVIATSTKVLSSNIEILPTPLLRTKVRVDPDHINVYGYFAITEKPDFVLLKVTPIPLRITNQSYWIVEVPTDVIAVEYNSQVYFQLSDEELRESISIKEDTYLCSPSVVKNIESNQNCVIDEIYGRTEKNACDVREVKITSIVWKQLYTSNSWVYVTNKIRRVALICNGIREDITLNNTGIIQISQECIIKTKRNILTPKKTATVRLLEGFTKHVPMSYNATRPAQHHHDVEKLGDEPIIGLSEEFGRLTEQETDIQSELQDVSWKHISHHPAIISSVTGFTIFGLMLIIWGVVRFLPRRFQSKGRREAPDPPETMVPLKPLPAPKSLRAPRPKPMPTAESKFELQPLRDDDDRIDGVTYQTVIHE